jgi:hypothetical protein
MDKDHFSKTRFRQLIIEIEGIVDWEMTPNRTEKSVEHIRYLSEFLIYSHQNSLTYFELFIEKKVLDTFSQILIKGNIELNKQLIQTMSILIQNIETEQDSFFLFSHPFLNNLVSYNFDLTGENELIDYFISFLKMLSLKLNSSTIQFFYNKRFKEFPLYGVAAHLYNHPEPMVRTAARAITLNIYNIWCEEMTECILSLPHATYFPNMASQLRKLWKRIDESLLKELNFDDLRDEIEDINDALMYFEDIFKANNEKITRALANSLIYYAYFPCLIGSVGWVAKSPDITSYSAAIFFLSQTFNYIKERSFINTLSIALFMQHIPQQFGRWISGPTRVPRSFSEKYTKQHSISNLSKYTEEKLSLYNIELFIHSKLNFLSELQDEYEELKRVYSTSKDADPDWDEFKRKGIELIANELKPKEASRIMRYHTQLSVALGRPIGLMEKEKEYDLMSPTDFTELILTSMYENRYRKYIMYNKYLTNENAQTLQNFLRSKDDSLVLLISSLMYAYMNSSAVDSVIHYYSKLFPIGKITAKMPENMSEEEGEEVKIPRDSDEKLSKNGKENSTIFDGLTKSKINDQILSTFKEIKYDRDIVTMIFNLLCTDPPFRLITFKFLAIILEYLWFNGNLDDSLHQEDYEQLINAWALSIRHIKLLMKNSRVSQCFLEIFEHQWKNFVLHDESKLSRVVRNPWALVPIFDDAYKDKLPEYLKVSETNVNIVKEHIQRFLTLSNFLNKFKVQKAKLQVFDYPFNFSTRDVYTWNIGDTVVADDDKTLVLWYLAEGKYTYKRYLVLDPEFFILADDDCDDSILHTIKIQIKLSLKNIVVHGDAKNPNKMMIAIYEYDYEGDWKHSYFPIIFENSMKLSAVKKTIEENQRQQSQFLDTWINSFFDDWLETLRKMIEVNWP